MANNLTGDYEAVVEVSVRQINGLLATLHQSGVSEDAPRPLLHSAGLRVGDPHRRPRPPVAGDFGEWVQEYQRARGPVGLNDLRTHLTANAPPGAAKVIDELFLKFGEAQLPPPPPDTVRGRVQMQLSPLTLSVPSGSTSEVIAHAFVRAHYYPDHGTTDLPKPVHGEVQATFEVRWQRPLFDGTGAQELFRWTPGKTLLIQPSAQDSKIQFSAAPGTGLSAGDVAKISVQVRKAVRENFPLLSVDLTASSSGQEFPFPDFKGLGSGPGQAIALPIQLSPPDPSGADPPRNIQSVNNLFTGPSGFALAVSKDYVESLLRSFLDSLTTAPSFKVMGITINVSFSLAPLDWADGTIAVSGRVEFDNPGPNQWITFKQVLTLELNVGTQRIAIRRVGEAEVNESFLIFHSTAVNAVRAARDGALPVGGERINNALHDARTRLDNALQSFDESASARFTAVEITHDGVIIRGNIDSTAVRYAPIIDIAETDQGQAFTALNSWIPGGHIERLTWSWVEYTSFSILSGVTKSSPPEEHRFIFPKPAAITDANNICLSIEGKQTAPNGYDVGGVTGGTTCHVPNSYGGIMEVPSWFEPVTVPIWLPDSTAEAVLNDVIAGHVSVQADTPRKNELSHNSLVYFADWRADKPLEVLGQALGQMRRKSVSLVVIVVLPAGAFDSRRREVEARLGSISERFSARLLLTEDNEGGWTRTFAVAKIPSAYLINARREFVWKHEGEADPKVLAAALDEHLLAAPAPRASPLRLAVAPGERAPDVQFGDDAGNRIRLRGLRGRAVLLNFWQAWSAPSIKELGRLERLQKEAGAQAPFIVAFHGGKERKTLGEIRKRHGLSFVLAHDAEQRIARIYGVHCWPTTISVNADGLIDHVQFGIAHAHASPPKGKKAEAN